MSFLCLSSVIKKTSPERGQIFQKYVGSTAQDLFSVRLQFFLFTPEINGFKYIAS